MSKIYPAPGFLLIEILEDANKTKEGIYLPHDLQDEPMRARVLKVGHLRDTEYGYSITPPMFKIGKKETLSLIKPGDIIYFKKHTQNEIPGYDDVKLAFIPFETVCGLFEDEK